MTLKQVLWTCPVTFRSHTFVYYEINAERWWCVPSFLKFYGIKSSSQKGLQNYGLGNVPKKLFSDFKPLKNFLANKTSFILTEDAMIWLKKWQEKQKKLELESFKLLEETLLSPQGVLVEKRLTFTSKNKLPKFEFRDNRPEFEETLLALVRTSLSFSLVAKDLLCQKKPITLNDIELFQEYASQLTQYIQDLPIQTPSVRNDFIDIEVK